MSEQSQDSAAQAVPGRGHTVTRIINGKKVEIPWGFTDFRKEGKAAKAAGVEYPGTSKAVE